ncbi:MAG TPA: NAD-dependent epimerase/dehydratase family protein [Candidatus Nanoarchaeia archaeon]|nr:NAD-dependent epimerase/dehydratase family protein [Candidatus Nanoarchaeia archaeon]
MKYVLVTGANGYVGQHVVDELHQRGHHVVGFIHKGTAYSAIAKKLHRTVIGDILDRKSLDSAVRNADSVIHLAAAMRKIPWKENYDVNVVGTQNLIESCKAHGVKRVIFTSSVGVLKRKLGPYGKTKLMAERLFENSGLEYTIFRPEMIYGIGGVGIHNVIQFTLGFPWIIPLVGYGGQTRQPIRVEDVATVLVGALDNTKTIGKTYPLCGKQKLKFRELVDLVAKAAGVRKLKVPVPVFLCYAAAKLLEKTLSKPPFTSENVRNLSQTTVMDPAELEKDMKFNTEDVETGINNLIQEMKKRGVIFQGRFRPEASLTRFK